MIDKPQSNSYLDGDPFADGDEPELDAMIVPGRGKLEGVSYSSDPRIEAAVREILSGIGEQPDREGLLKTPTRVAQMYAELTAGYHVDPDALINDAIFRVSYDEMALVKNIDFYSLCEHHMLPFMGQVHVAYIPNGKVVGLSKIPRIVEMFARRLQVQERMTVQIADFINQHLEPAGVAVVAEGVHMCSVMRGVKKANASMVTSAMRGVFRDDSKTRSEFMAHVGRARQYEA
jgi:GTP cyclohydrolase IA